MPIWEEVDRQVLAALRLHNIYITSDHTTLGPDGTLESKFNALSWGLFLPGRASTGDDKSRTFSLADIASWQFTILYFENLRPTNRVINPFSSSSPLFVIGKSVLKILALLY